MLGCSSMECNVFCIISYECYVMRSMWYSFCCFLPDLSLLWIIDSDWPICCGGRCWQQHWMMGIFFLFNKSPEELFSHLSPISCIWILKQFVASLQKHESYLFIKTIKNLRGSFISQAVWYRTLDSQTLASILTTLGHISPL